MKNICIIIGDPIEHTMSPEMHNLAYKSLGIDDRFVYVSAKVSTKDLPDAIKGLRAMNIKAITCTIPHKEAVIDLINELSEEAKQIGAVNSIINVNGKLIGHNTDWIGITNPLLKRLKNLKDVKIALIGAGGTARAVCFAAKKSGAKLKIFNRTLSEARKLASQFDAEAFGLDQIAKISDCKVIINSTNAGMGELTGVSLVPEDLIRSNMIVFDNVYNPADTRLILDAKKNGAEIIYGYEMLLHQGIAQFELYTGLKAPENVMEDCLVKNLF